MTRLILNPKSGTRNQANNIEFKIEGLDYSNIVRVHFENATVGVPVLLLNSEHNYIEVPAGSSLISGFVDLQIPEFSSNVVASIYATVSMKQEFGGFEPVTILHDFYEIVHEQSKSLPGKFYITPTFAAERDFCTIHADAEPDKTYVASINDKRYAIRTNAEGKGTISFRCRDVLGPSVSRSIQKFPLEIYTDDSNFTERLYSGSAINVLPDSLIAAATCIESGSTTLPDVCYVNESGNEVVRTSAIAQTENTAGGLTADVTTGGTVSTWSSLTDVQAEGVSAVIGPNNKVFLATSSIVTSGSDRYGQISVTIRNSTFDNAVFPLSLGAVIPDDDFGHLRIVIPSAIYDNILTTSGLKMHIFHDTFNFASYDVSMLDVANNVLVSTPTNIDNQSLIDNVPFLLYYNCASTISPASYTLPLIKDKDANEISAANPSIAIRPGHMGLWRDFYVYIVAEGTVGRTSQLFLYTLYVQDTATCASTPENSGIVDSNKTFGFAVKQYGWKQLTFGSAAQGENRNPKAVCDNTGNLHIFWESDRSGISQVYYGMLGPSQRSLNGCLASVIDRHEDFLRDNDDKPHDYTDNSLWQPITTTAMDLSRIIDEFTVGNMWLENETGSGTVTITDNETIGIQGNPLKDQAIAFAVLDKDVDGNSFDRFDQLSFGFSFDIVDNLAEVALTEKDIDALYVSWKNGFTSTPDTDATNAIYYVQNGNKFQVGRLDEVYDTIIPIAGSYDYSAARTNLDQQVAAISSVFQANLSRDDSTLKNYMLSLMPEKVIFRAKNTQSQIESGLSDSEYIEETENTILTGRYKLGLFIKTNNDWLNDAADVPKYALFRQSEQSFNFQDAKNIQIGVHYAKLFSEDAGAVFTCGDQIAALSQTVDHRINSGRNRHSIAKIGDRIGVAFIQNNSTNDLYYTEIDPNTRETHPYGPVAVGVDYEKIKLVEHQNRPVIAFSATAAYGGELKTITYNGSSWDDAVIGDVSSTDPSAFDIAVINGQLSAVFRPEGGSSGELTYSVKGLFSWVEASMQPASLSGGMSTVKGEPILIEFNDNPHIFVCGSFVYYTSFNSTVWGSWKSTSLTPDDYSSFAVSSDEKYMHGVVGDASKIYHFRTDGSSSASKTVSDINSAYIVGLTSVGGKLYAVARETVEGLRSLKILQQTESGWNEVYGSDIDTPIASDFYDLSITNAFGKLYIGIQNGIETPIDTVDEDFRIREVGVNSNEGYYVGDILITVDNAAAISQAFYTKIPSVVYSDDIVQVTMTMKDSIGEGVYANGETVYAGAKTGTVVSWNIGNRTLVISTNYSWEINDIVIGAAAYYHTETVSNEEATRLSGCHQNFAIGVGFPGGGKLRKNDSMKYLPDIYDDGDVDLEFSNIKIGLYPFTLDITLSEFDGFTRNTLDMIVPSALPESLSQLFSFSGSSDWRLTLGTDIENNSYVSSTFAQVPITFAGLNVNPCIAKDNGDTMNLVWQSNRSRYWNIYTSHDNILSHPFRYETQVTNTKSNSIMPRNAVDFNFNRMVVWHDNRFGHYQVMSARASGEDSYGESFNRRNVRGGGCETKRNAEDIISSDEYILVQPEDGCPIEFMVTNNSQTQVGFHFIVRFFSDAALQNEIFVLSSLDDPLPFAVNSVDLSADGYIADPLEQFEIAIDHEKLSISEEALFNSLHYITLQPICLIVLCTQPWSQIQRATPVTSDNYGSNNAMQFGRSVAIGHEWMAVGAPLDNESGNTQGAISVYRHFSDGTFWEFKNRFTPSGNPSNSEFGASISIGGDTRICVGSPGEEAVYFYQLNGDVFEYADKITKPTGANGFGSSVAMSGRYAAIGAPDDSASDGLVYIYKDDGLGNYSLVDTLDPAGGAAAECGTSVAMYGNNGEYVLIGAPQHTGGTGKVYLYKNNGSDTYVAVAASPFTASDAGLSNLFGSSVAIDNNRFIVGAPDNGVGAAYVFLDSGGDAWAEEEKLISGDPVGVDSFGASVDIDSSIPISAPIAIAVCGATLDDRSEIDGGAAYVFEKENAATGWNEVRTLVMSDAAANDQFSGADKGLAISGSGTFIAVGAALKDTDIMTDRGVVYIYDACSSLSYPDIFG